MKTLFAFVAIVAAVLALYVAILNPLYGDEIYYRSLLGTSVRNDFHRITIYPTCSSSFMSKLPVSWYASALLLEQLFNLLTSPLSLRVFSAIVGSLNCLLLGIVVSSRFPRLDRMSAYTAGMLFMGIFPFYLVLARPEGLVLLGVLSALAFSRVKPSSNYRGALLQQLVILLVFLLTLPIHPVALFFIPVFGYALFSRSYCWRLRLFGGGVLGALVFEGGMMHAQLVSCPESSVVSEFWGHHQGVGSDLVVAPFDFVEARLRNLFGSLRSLEFLIPSTDESNFGITPRADSNSESVVVAILSSIGLSVIVGALAMILMGLRRIYFSARVWCRAILPCGLYLALLVSVLGGLSIQPAQMPYRLSLWVPLLVLLAAVSYQSEPLSLPSSWEGKKPLFFLVALLASVFSFCYVYLPIVQANLLNLRTEYRSFSSGILSPTQIQEDVAKLSEFCPAEGISPNLQTAVDRATYWYFLDARVHLFWVYLIEVHGADRKSLVAMSEEGLDQIVVQCSSVPATLLEERWLRSGPICCLPKSTLKKMKE